MSTRRLLTTITTEGGLLSADLLTRLARQPTAISGTNPEDYHLLPHRRLRDAISRSWTELQGSWSAFAAELTKLPASERTTSVTRERWLLPLFAELGFGRLQRTTSLAVGGRNYPISHLWGAVPIHLLGADVDLDRRTKGVVGATTAAPFSMVQEFLHRSNDHLWAILSNGRRLRLFRDNTNLTRAAYVEFDLEAMFSGQVFTDFAVLWMICHESRFEADQPANCWLERWMEEARQQGVRALDRLRAGFERAIDTLGEGFLAHPTNIALRDRLRRGELATEEYHSQILRLIYRFVFLLVAEDRDLFHPPNTSDNARRRYSDYYSLGRIRDHARRHLGGRHSDLFASVCLVFGALGAEGIPALGVPALGSFLWSPDACPDLDTAMLANSVLLAALRHLSYTELDHALERIDYANLGPEELGGVYESLLELHPRLEIDAGRFEIISIAGSERKSTGSYYTPSALVSSLLDTALDPLLDEAMRATNPEDALLSLKVVDPACGSGHFLIAAGRRIAARLASVRSEEFSPSPSITRHALREVVGRCLYGLDINPMALELAKINLWLEAVEPGRPLSFLDHHLLCGNALLGATPALLSSGIPDEAFVALAGDDRDLVKWLKKQNQRERRGQLELFGSYLMTAMDIIDEEAAKVAAATDDTFEERNFKERRWQDLVASEPYRNAEFVANLWCAAFVAPKRVGFPALTQDVFEAASSDPEHIDPELKDFIDVVARDYRFFHWSLAFPDVYGKEGKGGFDVVLGNPPWEKVKLAEKEFFSSKYPAIEAASGVERKRLIAALEEGDESDRSLWADFQEALAHAEATAHFLNDSGRYPLCGRGDVNTYAVFAELMRSLVAPTGRLGVILPTGIATDDTTKAFFQAVAQGELVSLYDFENREGVFPAVHKSYKFCLLTLSGRERPVRRAEFAFFCHNVTDLDNPDRRFALESEEISLLNPNTGTCPIFRSRREAEITLGVYRRVPVLIREGDEAGNPWGVRFRRLFDMTNDSGLFHGREQLEGLAFTLDGNVFRRGDEIYLPLLESKMVHQFDHRWGSYDGKDIANVPVKAKEDPATAGLPRYWVGAAEVSSRLQVSGWSHDWFLGFRGIARVVDERTVISTIVPRVAVGNSLPLMLHNRGTCQIALLGASLSSFALDFVARQKIGGSNLNFFLVKQLPVLPPSTYDERASWNQDVTIADWLIPRVLELTYTAWDLAGLAKELGYDGPPFRFDEMRRALLRAELDACFFHLYGIKREDVDYIMDTFPIVARHDVATFGEYLTKRLVLERYDAMMKATATQEPYECPLDPPLGDPRAAQELPGVPRHV